MRTIKFKTFLGVNNRIAETEMHTKDGSWLHDAVNIDIDNAGAIKRSVVPERIVAMSNPHSLFENLMVRAGVMYRVNPGASSYSEELLRLLISDNQMCYAKIGETIFMSNGDDAMRTNADGQLVAWGMPTPNAPVLTATPGELSKGEYLVALSFANCVEESGVSSMTRIVTEGGIRVALPAAVEGATHIHVYVSGNAGSAPMLAATVEVGEVSVDITQRFVGREAPSRVEDVLPAGTRVFEYNGRLCTTFGDTLYYGIPYKHGYYLPASGFIKFESTILMATCNQMGIYIAIEGKTMFLQGTDVDKVEIVRDLLPYGAVQGTEFDHPKESKVGWFSHKGVVLADNNGEVTNLMEPNIDQSPPAQGTSVVLTGGGIDRVVSCHWSVNLKTGAAARYEGVQFSSSDGVFATASDGVYDLRKNTGVADAVIHLGLEDFGSEQEKHLPAAYFTVASTDKMALRVGTSDGQSYTYDSLTYSDILDVIRVDPAKGLRSNWYKLEVLNTEGCDFKLESVSFPPAVSKRRI